ncbi:MAG: D-glycero-beta-D-manno-heptose 1-phosphate adenylyltransferase [Candidatus Omnitrophota bacterium]
MPEGKIMPLTELAAHLERLRSEGKKIIFTNGCFDILHFGHVKYLAQAKSEGDILVVGVNSDSSVKRLKSAGRPVNPEHARAGVIGSLECVDYVTIFSEDTPLETITALKPDVLVKGGDWQGKDIVGGEFVKSKGGKVKTVPFIDGYSTTAVISKIRHVSS